MSNKENFARVRCDSCKRYMNIKTIKGKNIGNDYAIQIQYFECSKCGAKYLITIDNSYTRTLKEEIRLLQDEANSENYKKIRNAKKELSESEAELRQRYKSKLEQEGFYSLDGQIAVTENVYEK